MRNPPYRPLHRPVSLALVAALVLPVAACSSGRGKADLPYVARDVGTLYTAAKTRLDRGSYTEAALLFDEVERQHPYSIWARRSQLMGAFSYYLARDYTKAIQSAQRFLSVHPGNRDAPYAYYLVALSYYEQIEDVTRDQKITQQAQAALGELIRRYPDTRYAADARLKLDLVADHLAGKEMEIGRFYQRRGQWLASTYRFRRVVQDYQTTTHAPEALLRLTESYLALGVRDEAEKSAAVLGANYPSSDWYDRAYALMKRNPATPIQPLPRGAEVVEVVKTPAPVGSPDVPTPTAAAPVPPGPATTGSSAVEATTPTTGGANPAPATVPLGEPQR